MCICFGCILFHFCTGHISHECDVTCSSKKERSVKIYRRDTIFIFIKMHQNTGKAKANPLKNVLFLT